MDFIAYQTPIFYLIQPLWRDEAFSVLLSSNSIVDIIKLTASDFNPPFYYLLLHLWMQFFGSSEIAVRSLSFIFHAILVYFVAHFFEKNYKFSKWKINSLIVLILLNPMLLYFAFEARMYSLLTLLSFLALYFLTEKKFKWFSLISVLGIYTHYYFGFVLFSLGVYVFFRKREILNKFLEKTLFVFLLFLPWGIIVINQLRNAGSTWFYPVDLNLAVSLLGSLYLGFEGTPRTLWNFAQLLSFLLAVYIIYYLLKVKKSRKEKDLAFVYLLSFSIPLILVAGISFFKRIFVLRYVIFTIPPLVLLYFLSLSSMKKNILSYFFLFLNIIFLICFNLYSVKYHRKVDFKKVVFEINLDSKEDSLIVGKTPLSFFELSYYSKDSSSVFLYNPKNQELPSYVGKVLIPRKKWINDQSFGKIIYLVADDGTFIKIQN